MLRMTGHVESKAGANGGLLLVMFHGYGNDESEMTRIVDAVRDVAIDDDVVVDDDVARLSWLSFRGTYDRAYMGGSYWYPDGYGVAERRGECSAVGDEVVSLLDASAFTGLRRVLVGFSQGGYLSYRMVCEHPSVFDAAILLSPSFKGEEGSRLPADSSTRFLLAYGSEDRTIPQHDQMTARRVLDASGRLEYREYAGMGHAICDREIVDIRVFLNAL